MPINDREPMTSCFSARFYGTSPMTHCYFAPSFMKMHIFQNRGARIPEEAAGH